MQCQARYIASTAAAFGIVFWTCHIDVSFADTKFFVPWSGIEELDPNNYSPQQDEICLGVFAVDSKQARLKRMIVEWIPATRDSNGFNYVPAQLRAKGVAEPPLFLIKFDPPQFRERTIPVAFSAFNVDGSSFPISFAWTDGTRYDIDTETGTVTSLTNTMPGECDNNCYSRNVVVRRGHEKFILEGYAERFDASWTQWSLGLLWAGDLDGDGKMDFIVEADRGLSDIKDLLLSSAANRGSLVKKVSSMSKTGD